MTVEHAVLRCDSCDADTRHEMHYSGRLLVSVRCTACGRHLELSQRDLVPAYARDLESRLLSKPRRMLRRAARDPLGFARDLPGAVARQPRKLLAELWTLIRR